MRTFFLLLLGSGWLPFTGQTVPAPSAGLKSQINYVCMERVRLQKYRTYIVAATKKGDGKDDRSSLVVGQTIGLQVNPNPATDRLVINTGPDAFQLIILDAFGKTIWEKTGLVGDETTELSIATWPSGFYFVRIETSSGRQTTRFIKSTR